MKPIVLGRAGKSDLEIDVDTLLRTRLLIQAGSGGGKSWCLRRIAEQLFGKVQVFLIDREGEFSTLREKYGYVLVGQDMDTPADIRSARKLAEKLLEINASAVCDLYEAFRAKPGDRRAWVRGFLEGVMDAPKKFWRNLVVIVDEAHLFCPQESPKAASMVEREIISGCKEAMISLATAGRKRGYCAVWATQRLAKLDKDASAELLNRIVGMTIEDVDVDRAVDLMSVSRDEKAKFRESLKNLEPGNFWAFGRAISKDRVLVKVGSVSTTHPEPGSSKQASEPPPPPEKVRGMLAKLADFPKEVESKAKTEAELRSEIRALRSRLGEAERRGQQAAQAKKEEIVKVKPVEVRLLKEGQLDRLESMIDRAKETAKLFHDAAFEVGAHAAATRQAEAALLQAARKRPVSTAPVQARPDHRVPAPRNLPEPYSPTGSVPLGKPEKAILSVLAYNPHGCTLDKIALLAGYRKSGGFRNAFSILRTSGYLSGPNTGTMCITPEGREVLGNYEPLPQGDRLADYWKQHPSFGTCERKLLGALLDNQEGLTIDQLAEAAGYAISGGFRNSISKLRTAGVLVGRSSEVMKVSDDLIG